MVVDLRRCGGGGGGGEEVLWKAALRRPTSRRCDPAAAALAGATAHTPQPQRLRPDTGLGCKSDGREGRGFVAVICHYRCPKRREFVISRDDIEMRSKAKPAQATRSRFVAARHARIAWTGAARIQQPQPHSEAA